MWIKLKPDPKDEFDQWFDKEREKMQNEIFRNGVPAELLGKNERISGWSSQKTT